MKKTNVSVKDLFVELRPKFFREVVGQQAVVTAITTMIAEKKIPNAILVTGKMGTGKSTLARLAVKSTCCMRRKHGDSEPCGRCISCEMIEAGMGSYGCSFFGPAYQADPKSLANAIRVVQAGGLLWSDTLPNALWIDDVDLLPSKSQVVLRGSLDESWDDGYLVATTTTPEKLDQPMRQRMVEFAVKRPEIPELENWVKAMATARLQLKIEEQDAIRDLVSIGERNYRSIIKILAGVYGAGAAINCNSVKLAALQCGYWIPRD